MKQIVITLSIFGGFLGLLIAGVFFWNSTGNKITTASIGIGIGVFLGCFIGSLLTVWKKEGYVLVRKVQKLNPLAGKRINDITLALGGYTAKQPTHITDRNNEIGSIYTFVDGKYEVKILVGADDICIGVVSEVLNGKKLK